MRLGVRSEPDRNKSTRENHMQESHARIMPNIVIKCRLFPTFSERTYTDKRTHTWTHARTHARTCTRVCTHNSTCWVAASYLCILASPAGLATLRSPRRTASLEVKLFVKAMRVQSTLKPCPILHVLAQSNIHVDVQVYTQLCEHEYVSYPRTSLCTRL